MVVGSASDGRHAHYNCLDYNSARDTKKCPHGTNKTRDSGALLSWRANFTPRPMKKGWTWGLGDWLTARLSRNYGCIEDSGSSLEWQLQRPRSPHIPIGTARRHISDNIHPVSLAQQVHPLLFAHGNNIDTVRFVRLKIEFLAQDASDPSVSDRSFVLGAVS
jgi:hypothetical protein